MEKEPRVNQSSIRYSNSAAKIVNAASGNTFSDKFESICLNFEKNKEAKTIRIKELDKEIAAKQKKLDTLNKKIFNNSAIADKAEVLQKLLSELTAKCSLD